MSDDTTAGGGKPAPANAFNSAKGYSGQEYHRDREAAQGRSDAGVDTPRARTPAEPPAPEDPDDFKAPGSSDAG